MWLDNVVLFLVTLTPSRSHRGSAADGETGEEAEANIPCSHNSRCGAYDVAGEEADESSCKAVALCADVEVAEHCCGGTPDPLLLYLFGLPDH